MSCDHLRHSRLWVYGFLPPRNPRCQCIETRRRCEHARRNDCPSAKRGIHRTSKNEKGKRVIPLNDSAFEAVACSNERTCSGIPIPCRTTIAQASSTRSTRRSRLAKRTRRCARCAMRRACRACGSRSRHTVVTRLLEAGEPDHVLESITDTSRAGCSSTILESDSRQRRQHSIAWTDRAGRDR